MTRTEAIAVITNALAAVDDTTLAAAAAHLENLDFATSTTVGDILKSLQTDSILPRPLTDREHAQIVQSHEDFRTGRTFTGDELDAMLDASAARRASSRGL